MTNLLTAALLECAQVPMPCTRLRNMLNKSRSLECTLRNRCNGATYVPCKMLLYWLSVQFSAALSIGALQFAVTWPMVGESTLSFCPSRIQFLHTHSISKRGEYCPAGTSVQKACDSIGGFFTCGYCVEQSGTIVLLLGQQCSFRFEAHEGISIHQTIACRR